jgi:nucleotide-binding universal stress UspA family protein
VLLYPQPSLGLPGGLVRGYRARWNSGFGAPIAINSAAVDHSMTVHSVLMAYDGTPPAETALAEAVEIQKATHAKLTVICVIPILTPGSGIALPPGETITATIEGARKMLEATKSDLVKKGVTTVETVLLEGDPVDQVVEYADQHRPDLIVVGSRGLSEAGRFFLGSVSDGILHHARGSVLVVKSLPPKRTKTTSHAM